jgi:hypothetical protein
VSVGAARQRHLSRLAQRVSVGEVVFFIGAGFSLDAEMNSAKALIVRLLLRFEALSEALFVSGRKPQQAHARKLQRSLRATFDLGPLPPQALAVNDLFDGSIDQHLDKLSDKYFLINDWLCTAFDEQLRLLDDHKPPRFDAQVRAQEDQLFQRLTAALATLPDAKRWWTLTDLHPGALDLPALLRFWRHCNSVLLARTERALGGKALFLDAMGFNETRVMAGAPMAQDMQAVQAGIMGRLSARHHALAWLAAEGLCPVVVTTNFDLLLDSAYRLAGLLPWNAPREAWPDERKEEQLDGGLDIRVPKNRRYSHFARISDAWQFFRHAQSGRAVHLYKIHGCADAYRIAHDKPTELRDLLPTIVFTFREIQNWREDAWSRDMLNTLLRTRTVAFAGYSGADPVIHDTFRTIYEEMAGYQSAARQSEALSKSSGARERLRGGGALASASNSDSLEGPRGESAPAFILARGREFHGQEILRAASRAAGERDPEITEHPNLLTFNTGADAALPTLDETFLLLYHECIRRLQRQALQSQLVQAYYRLSGQRSPVAEAQAIEREFEALVAHEEQEIAAVLGGATADPALRHRLGRVTGWTLHFHRQLMREFALAESFLRHPAEALTVERVTRLPWYCPASEHADWAAWGVVLELALRRCHASLAPGPAEPGSWTSSKGLWATEHNGPALAFVQQGVQRALVVELMPMRRVFMRTLPRPLRAVPALAWELNNETLPWWREGDGRRPPGTPPASTLWAWAARPADAWQAESAAKYFQPERSTA